MSDFICFFRENFYVMFFAVFPLVLMLIAATCSVVYFIWRGIVKMSAHNKNISCGIDAAEADMLIDDTEALSYIQRYGKKRPGKTCTVSVGDIGKCFSDGDIVTLNSLKSAGLAPSECGRVKILAGGKIDKALSIHADSFSLAAVKMIVTAGGTVNKIG